MEDNDLYFEDETDRYCHMYFSQLRLVTLVKFKYKLQKKIRSLNPCRTQELKDAYNKLFEEIDKVSAIEAKYLSKTVKL